jgi:hypothetical protein
MHVIVADEMQEFQVAEPVVLVVTVFMVDFGRDPRFPVRLRAELGVK